MHEEAHLDDYVEQLELRLGKLSDPGRTQAAAGRMHGRGVREEENSATDAVVSAARNCMKRRREQSEACAHASGNS